MLRKNVLFTLVTAAALTLPTATALWSAQGAFEPDYPGDVSALLMFPDPDTNPDSGVRQVYFNAFLTPGYWSGVNPNVAASQSRIVSASFQAPMAYLGVWKDCNQDGYIGQAESAVVEYRDEVLLDKSVCPPGASDFNREGWVYEFLWILDGNAADGAAWEPHRFINDTESYVWGDPGLPGSAGAIACYINPQTGAFSSTGALIAFADCNGNRGIQDTWNAVVDNTTSGELNSQLRFDDTAFPQCEEHPLNVELNLFDNDPRCPSGKTGLFQQHSDNPSFTTWECSNVQHHSVAHPVTGNTLVEVYVPGVSTSPNFDPDGSYYDAANHTFRGVESGKCTDDRESNTTIDGFYGIINPEEAVAAGVAQREATFTLDNRGSWLGKNNRNSVVCRTPPGASEPICTPAPLGEENPGFGGLSYPRNALGLIGPIYSADSARTDYFPTVRDDLQPEGPSYYTFYARVSTQTTGTGALVPGGSGVYGSEICGSNTVDVINGFDCNADRWYKPEYGASEMPRSWWSDKPLGQVPGATYNLRDIDCYDGSLAAYTAPGVGLGLTWLAEESSGNGPCANY